jgi:GDP-D-mannose dehydratase
MMRAPNPGAASRSPATGGSAPEYVEAMWRMLQQDEPQDFVIATGESHTLEELTSAALACFNLDGHDHVYIDQDRLQPRQPGKSQTLDALGR